ncbi:MAG: NADH-ubiquinone oxidoreductase-F iron-sulfur binding region domain-containing protein [Candidatus Pacebacteria bacterium]|nr:NADH-ubiquinone oxidoreductase-F iron-sulfur binding region domain-containing protein [Candidatus Paceibacterota bacterium]MDD5012922.1 NADH-ubiquinone oxidoreductase-F iron-sulfur binding region domain-containing protein [Candidatus Paceibacterota bacterium]MDD5752506.1 NADH-ubiquinone oxidoreductase-F iron-sulfur binding region domain-containing protein [Candidatus Paceibacterota bacterium]
MTKDIILKLKESNLLGRGGAGFPTWLKWDLVKKAKGDKKYVICNASEGEPCVFKDGYIIKNYPEEMINGIVLAMEAVNAFEAWIYLNKDYYSKYSNKLKKIIGKKKINLFKKTGGYIGGEESALCESIEGNRVEPRFKPPYLAEKGLFGCPTLVNNVETFYYASKVDKGEYNQTRFYSINGDVLNPGVYELEESLTMEQVLKKTENYPSFDFFIQAGGGAAGEIFLREELKTPCVGAGSITVYNKLKTDPFKLMEKWIEFFACGNCDKCLPCREGTYRLMEMIKRRKLNEEIMEQILFSLRETSFCALGRGIPVPFRSFLKKVMEIDL